MNPGADTTLPLGVYRGAPADITPIQGYESFLNMPAGKTVSFVVAFMADNPSWPQFEQAIMPAATNGGPGAVSATAWAPLLGGRQLMLAVPACCQGTTWAQEAAGVNDAHWTALARTLADAGLAGCALRVGREMTGSWYRWKATPGNVSSYIAGYQHVMTVLSAAGFTGKRVWNPYIGPGNFGSSTAQAAYPGNSYVDWIGVDLYDGPSANYPANETIRTPAQQQAVWNGFLNGQDGLAAWRNFAAGNGKGTCYPEWGLRLWNDGGIYQGGGDNPLYVREMAGWLKDTAPRMHAFWEDPRVGVADADDFPGRLIAVPQARAVFLEEFGY